MAARRRVRVIRNPAFSTRRNSSIGDDAWRRDSSAAARDAAAARRKAGGGTSKAGWRGIGRLWADPCTMSKERVVGVFCTFPLDDEERRIHLCRFSLRFRNGF